MASQILLDRRKRIAQCSRARQSPIILNLKTCGFCTWTRSHSPVDCTSAHKTGSQTPALLVVCLVCGSLMSTNFITTSNCCCCRFDHKSPENAGEGALTKQLTTHLSLLAGFENMCDNKLGDSSAHDAVNGRWASTSSTPSKVETLIRPAL